MNIHDFAKGQTCGFSFGMSKEAMVKALRSLADEFEAGSVDASAVKITHELTLDDFASMTLELKLVERKLVQR